MTDGAPRAPPCRARTSKEPGLKHPAGARLLSALILIIGLASAPTAPADEGAACPDGHDDLTLPEDLAAYERQLARRAPACADRAGFLAWHGAILLRLGRPREAADQLERALLLNPRLMGARLDYAQALLALGERQTARELLRELAARPDIPPAATPLLHSRWRSNGALALRAGYDSNLNLATADHALTLTLPDAPLILPLNTDSRAQPGSSLGLDGAWRLGLGVPGDERWHIETRLSHRGSPDQDAGLTQFDLQALRHIPDTGGESQLGLGMGEQRWRGTSLQRQLRLLARTAPAPTSGACRDWMELGVEARLHPGSPEFDHHLIQALASRGCTTDAPWLAQIGVGREIAWGARPGGDAWTLSGRLLIRRPIGPDGLELELRAGLRRDDQGYSPLLANDTPLTAHTLRARLEYRHALEGNAEAFLHTEIERQWATLPLFEWQRRAIHTGLRWQW